MLSNSVMSNSLRPHGPQPTRLLCPWNFPGRNTGVGCHCLLQVWIYIRSLFSKIQNNFVKGRQMVNKTLSQNLSSTSCTFSAEFSDQGDFSFLVIRICLIVVALVIELYTFHMFYFPPRYHAELRSKNIWISAGPFVFSFSFFFLSVWKDHYSLNLPLQSKMSPPSWGLKMSPPAWACLPLCSSEPMSFLAGRKRKAIEYFILCLFDKKARLFLFIGLKLKMGQSCK